MANTKVRPPSSRSASDMYTMRLQTSQPANIKAGILGLTHHDARRDERHHPPSRPDPRAGAPEQPPEAAVRPAGGRDPLAAAPPDARADPFEQAFYLYQKRLNERLATPFARQFYFKQGQPASIDFAIKWAERGHTMERGIGRVTRSGKWAWDDELLAGSQGEKLADPEALREALYTEAESRVSEDGERLSFGDRLRVERPFPRRTEADRNNDVRRLDRALDRTLYLVVKKNGAERFAFPQDNVHPDEGLHETAARALAASAGVNMNTWMVGRAPIAYEHSEPLYTGGREGDKEATRRIKRYGWDVFYLKARIMAGQVDLTENKWGVADFKWLTKDELSRAIDQKTFVSVKDSMPAR